MNAPTKKPPSETKYYGEADTIRRRDEAVRRALNTPPKPYKDAKVGKSKPTPTSSRHGKA